MATPQSRRLERLKQRGIHQTNVLVHDDNRASLDELRPHLLDPLSSGAFKQLVDRMDKARPVNVAQVKQISPFRYPGGKTWLVPVVREWLELIERPRVFLEPFAGGGVIGLTVAAENLADEVVMVELDEEVSAVWHVLLEGSSRTVKILCNKVSRFEPTLENVLAILESEPTRMVDKAFKTIVKNRCQRGGILAPGAGLIKNGEAGRGLSSRWYPETLVKRFSAIQHFRERITFIEGDAFEVISDYSGATMFVDPPYTAAGKKAGSRLYSHSVVDHKRLFDLIDEHAKSALLTYDDTPEIRAKAAEYGFSVGNVAMTSTHNVVMHELTIFKN
ncbi:DNA adenine methylase [Actinomyces sp.]|uniref:DNA adenine methylase n=1 Tax=Actinomyces sp. TaxID=29317 RepID=UPI00290645C7|nr:DNA adenine methylase [Actinomyces sp.]MDU5232358.1 DNA adenine methylase [Actinomyces sp.]